MAFICGAVVFSLAFSTSHILRMLGMGPFLMGSSSLERLLQLLLECNEGFRNVGNCLALCHIFRVAFGLGFLALSSIASSSISIKNVFFLPLMKITCEDKFQLL